MSERRRTSDKRDGSSQPPPRTSPRAPEETVLLDLVARGLERIEAGETLDLAELCKAHPALAPEVAESLGIVDQVPRLREAGRKEDALFGAVLGGRYKLFSSIGAGAMGVVYRGEDLELGRPVAVKVMRDDALPGDEAVERFNREGEALAAIHHPSVVSVFDRGKTADDRYYLVMELVDGVPLHELAVDQPPSVRTVVHWISDLAEGLCAAHEAGVYHRDVKPSNVVIRRDGRASLIDFGIAARDAHATLARGTQGLGTPAYMAPEQLRAGVPARPTADVYGLTTTLYQALTGHAPYEGTPSQVLARIPREDPTPAEKLRRGLPRDLLAILEKGLARNPKRRYQSVAELRDDLEAFLEHAPVTARYTGPIGRTWRRMRRSVVVRTALVVVVLGIGGLWAREGYLAGRVRRVQAWQEEMRRIQPALAQWSASRVLPAEARADTEGRLDRAVALADHPIPARMIRAAFRFDHGEFDAAAADARGIAETLGTALSRELSERYAAVARDPESAFISTDLPEAVTADDLLLTAFHAARRRDFATCDAILAKDELADVPYAREMLLLGEVDGLRRTIGRERFTAASRIFERTLALESDQGYRSASTLNLLGSALLALGRPREAGQRFLEGLELAPYSASLHGNLAIVRRKAREFDEAERLLERAIELRPGSLSWPHTLCQVYGDRMLLTGDLSWKAEIEEVITRPIYSEVPGVVRRLRGEAHFVAMLALLSKEDPARAQVEAREALSCWAGGQFGDPVQVAAARGVVVGQVPFEQVLESLIGHTDEWSEVRAALLLMPDQLDGDDVDALRALFRDLLEQAAPGSDPPMNH